MRVNLLSWENRVNHIFYHSGIESGGRSKESERVRTASQRGNAKGREPQETLFQRGAQKKKRTGRSGGIGGGMLSA